MNGRDFGLGFALGAALTGGVGVPLVVRKTGKPARELAPDVRLRSARNLLAKSREEIAKANAAAATGEWGAALQAFRMACYFHGQAVPFMTGPSVPGMPGGNAEAAEIQKILSRIVAALSQRRP